MRHTIGILALSAALSLVACEKKPAEAPAKPQEPAGQAVDPAPAPAAVQDPAAPAPAAAAIEPSAPVTAATAAEPGTTTESTTTAQATETKPAEGCGDVKPEDCAGSAAGCGGCPNCAAKGPDAAAAGCGAVATTGTTTDSPAPSDAPVAHFGAAFTLTETQPIAAVLSKAAELSGQIVGVEATISKVCQRKGCWFVLQGDDGAFVRVTMKDYGFFVPVDSTGKRVVVEGVFKRVEVAEAAAQHLAEDGGEDPSKVQGARVELRLVATAIDIKG